VQRATGLAPALGIPLPVATEKLSDLIGKAQKWLIYQAERVTKPAHN
jgi:hypothetical protein